MRWWLLLLLCSQKSAAWPTRETQVTLEDSFTLFVASGHPPELGANFRFGLGVFRAKWDGQLILRVDGAGGLDRNDCGLATLLVGAEFGAHFTERVRFAVETLVGGSFSRNYDEGCLKSLSAGVTLLADAGPEVILHEWRSGKQLYVTARVGVAGLLANIFSDRVSLNFSTGFGFRF